MFGKPAGTGLFGNNNVGAGAGAGASAGGGLFGANNNTASTGGGLFGASNNTNNTNTGMFGNKSNTTGATGGLFGANNNTNPAPTTGGGLFGSNNNANPAPTTGGGLFGSNNNANPAPTAGGGLFGASNNANPTSTTGGGLFGASNNTNPAPTTGGGLFGAKPASTGGLFGNNNTNTTGSLGSAGSTGGLFGNKPGFGGATNNTTGTSIGGGLFGSKPAGTTGGLFGNNNNNTGLGSGSVLGGSTLGGNTLGGGLGGNTLGGSTLGGGLFGSQAQMQQQQQSQSALQSISQLAITPMTRIADFPPQIRAEIEQLDQYIQKQVQISEHLKADDQDHNELISSIPRDIAYLSKVQSMAMQSLQKDLKKISKNKELTDSNLTDTQMFAIILQQILTPGSKISSLELEKFFQNKITIYQAKLDDYFRVLSDIESAVNGIHYDIFGGDNESSSKNFSELDKEKEKAVQDLYAMKTGLNAIISTVIEEFKLFMSTADQIAALHQQVKVTMTNK